MEASREKLLIKIVLVIQLKRAVTLSEQSIKKRCCSKSQKLTLTFGSFFCLFFYAIVDLKYQQNRVGCP
jgi:hypothetical protein